MLSKSKKNEMLITFCDCILTKWFIWRQKKWRQKMFGSNGKKFRMENAPNVFLFFFNNLGRRFIESSRPEGRKIKKRMTGQRTHRFSNHGVAFAGRWPAALDECLANNTGHWTKDLWLGNFQKRRPQLLPNPQNSIAQRLNHNFEGKTTKSIWVCGFN